MSWDRFGLLLHQHKAGIKSMLMDQSFTAGIGNLYSDEMLYQAGLRYDRPSNTLTATEVRRLYRAIVETLADAIKHRGLVAGRRAVPGSLRRDRRLPGLAPGLRPRGPTVPALPQRDRPGQDRRAVDLLLRALPGLTSSRAVGPSGCRPVPL